MDTIGSMHHDIVGISPLRRMCSKNALQRTGKGFRKTGQTVYHRRSSLFPTQSYDRAEGTRDAIRTKPRENNHTIIQTVRWASLSHLTSTAFSCHLVGLFLFLFFHPPFELTSSHVRRTLVGQRHSAVVLPRYEFVLRPLALLCVLVR